MKYWILVFLCIASVVCGEENADQARKRDNYVFNLIKSHSIGIEIGVWRGTFAKNVLIKTQPEHLYLVDPWEYPPQRNPKYGQKTSGRQAQVEQMYEHVCSLFKNDQNITILRMTSKEASVHFPDEFFDFIYVDGDHSYVGVMDDLVTYLPKLKKDGILIGSDYGFKSIKIAVRDFLETYQKEYFLTETKFGQYVIEKK